MGVAGPLLEMKRGDVILVAPYPPFSKPRPAVIVQGRVFETDENVTVALITSDLARMSANRVQVQPGEHNGLRKISEVMLDLLITVPKGRIGGRVGALEPPVMMRLDAALRVFLGL